MIAVKQKSRLYTEWISLRYNLLLYMPTPCMGSPCLGVGCYVGSKLKHVAQAQMYPNMPELDAMISHST